MEEILDWLMRPDFMNFVGFYAGGTATAVGAIWVAITKLRGENSKRKQEPAEASRKTSANATNGIAANRDVSIGGDFSISQTPKAAWIVLGLGIACLGVAASFGGDRTKITNGAQVGGDMERSTINIGQ